MCAIEILLMSLQTKCPDPQFDTVYDEWLYYKPDPHLNRTRPKYVCYNNVCSNHATELHWKIICMYMHDPAKCMQALRTVIDNFLQNTRPTGG